MIAYGDVGGLRTHVALASRSFAVLNALAIEQATWIGHD